MQKTLHKSKKKRNFAAEKMKKGLFLILFAAFFAPQVFGQGPEPIQIPAEVTPAGDTVGLAFLRENQRTHAEHEPPTETQILETIRETALPALRRQLPRYDSLAGTNAHEAH